MKNVTVQILLACVLLPTAGVTAPICSMEFIDDIMNNREVSIQDKIRLGQDDPNCVDEKGNAAIYIATNYAKVESAKVLLDKGADPRFIHPELGTTSLHAVAWYGNGKNHEYDFRNNLIMAVELIRKGADPDQPDADGKTPRDMNATLIEEAIKIVNGQEKLLEKAERRLRRAMKRDPIRIEF